ncbi:ribosome small subunit-dependent GTPase A [Planctomyces sp. SH-PL14]|uniref:ribosome small subunit-dependent GTPase A n=1 Tax=Planctomyces sp. SH-PL14 TaxID=1632864 RepID=UPI00078B2454|nr:ribosome small subunit-dependent GTPase A [Planctomyces sp. SH-PL14]AMV17611.1 Putative ribosome biogenesis GTPase RsgA [Planctomyces sp. SH-PL14]
MTGPRKKSRVAFKKNHDHRPRRTDLTRHDVEDLADLTSDERVSGKGALTRQRTIITDDEGALVVDESVCIRGRVLWAVGANHCSVRTERGILDCRLRRRVRDLARDTRNAVATGDLVLVRPENETAGIIERIEPRRSTLSRGQGRHAHLIVANVDQAVIVASATDPPLKPTLIDRFLVSCEAGGVQGIVCVNKADLIDPVPLQPILGQYSRIGYPCILLSAQTGQGVKALRRLLSGKTTVFTGQSGVGKSTLLNMVQPGLGLKTGAVSDDSGKGRHTTRVSQLLELDCGGWVVDTPGIRQLQLWNVAPQEVEGYFREFPPFVAHCHFPDCTHTHESGCRVKSAVDEGLLSPLRYESYVRMFESDAIDLAALQEE